jgi:hypothetical protein
MINCEKVKFVYTQNPITTIAYHLNYMNLDCKAAIHPKAPASNTAQKTSYIEGRRQLEKRRKKKLNKIAARLPTLTLLSPGPKQPRPRLTNSLQERKLPTTQTPKDIMHDASLRKKPARFSQPGP